MRICRQRACFGIRRRRRCDIQHYDRDAALCELLHHRRADAAAASSHENYLPAPVPGLVGHVVVECQALEVIVGAVEYADGEERFERSLDCVDVDIDVKNTLGELGEERLLWCLRVSEARG